MMVMIAKKNTVSDDNDDHDDGSAGSVLADLASGSPVIYRVVFTVYPHFQSQNEKKVHPMRSLFTFNIF